MDSFKVGDSVIIISNRNDIIDDNRKLIKAGGCVKITSISPCGQYFRIFDRLTGHFIKDNIRHLTEGEKKMLIPIRKYEVGDLVKIIDAYPAMRHEDGKSVENGDILKISYLDGILFGFEASYCHINKTPHTISRIRHLTQQEKSEMNQYKVGDYVRVVRGSDFNTHPDGSKIKHGDILQIRGIDNQNTHFYADSNCNSCFQNAPPKTQAVAFECIEPWIPKKGEYVAIMEKEMVFKAVKPEKEPESIIMHDFKIGDYVRFIMESLSSSYHQDGTIIKKGDIVQIGYLTPKFPNTIFYKSDRDSINPKHSGAPSHHRSITLNYIEHWVPRAGEMVRIIKQYAGLYNIGDIVKVKCVTKDKTHISVTPGDGNYWYPAYHYEPLIPQPITVAYYF